MPKCISFEATPNEHQFVKIRAWFNCETFQNYPIRSGHIGLPKFIFSKVMQGYLIFCAKLVLKIFSTAHTVDI